MQWMGEGVPLPVVGPVIWALVCALVDRLAVVGDERLCAGGDP
jgi:hypothetical protein